MTALTSASSILVQLATQLPMVLVAVAGLILALVYWRRFRVASVLTLIASILLGTVALALPVVTVKLYHWQNQHHWTARKFGFLSLDLKLASSLCQAVGVGLLLAAVFSGRHPPAVRPPATVPPPLPFS